MESAGIPANIQLRQGSAPYKGDEIAYSVSFSRNTAAIESPLECSKIKGVNGEQNDNSLRHAGAACVCTGVGIYGSIKITDYRGLCWNGCRSPDSTRWCSAGRFSPAAAALPPSRHPCRILLKAASTPSTMRNASTASSYSRSQQDGV